MGTINPELPNKGDPLGTSDSKIRKSLIAIRDVINGGIDADNLEGGAVTEAKLADSAATSRKAKLTAGMVAANGDLTLGDAYQDVPGATLEITPAVESKLLVLATYNFGFTEQAQGFKFYGTLKLDSNAEEANCAKLGGNNASFEATVSQPYLLTLSGGAHTIKMRAKKEANAASNPRVFATNTRFLYLLVAA